MSRRNRSRSKAITPSSVARQGGAVRDATTDVATMTLQETNATVPPMATLLPTPPAWGTMPFGPGTPFDPQPINPVRPDSGRPEPRLWEYPVSWNLSTAAQRLIPWVVLRNAADGVSMFRRCIQVRKDHIAGLDWDVVIGQDALDAAQRKADKAERAAKKSTPPPAPASGGNPAASVAPGVVSAPVQPGQPQPPTVSDSGDAPDQDTPAAGRAAVEDEMRERLAPDIDRAKKFLKVPDRGNGTDFTGWVSKALEEVFVLDALCIYPRYTLGGDLYSLEIVDGSTIKPLLDERGGRPIAPMPAYQQVLYGFPRGEFTASVSETDGENGVQLEYDGQVFPSDHLIYAKRVDRVWSPYGLSAVEQALDDGALYLKRHLWMMAEYTDGTSIAGLYTTDQTTNWSPEQLLEYERAFNRVFQGASAERHQARFLPPGVNPVEPSGSTGSDAIAERYKPDYDLYLLKLMVSHFDTVLPEIGFTDAAAGGLGASGYHEGQEDVQMRKRLPIIKFLESLLTGILHDYFGAPDELEFKFLGLDDEDEPGAADVDIKRMNAGVTTLNEQRDQLGRSRYAFPEADMPFVSTGRGLVFIEGASQVAQPLPAGYLEGPPMPPKPGDGAAPGAPASSPPGQAVSKPAVAAPAQPGAAAQPTAPAAAKLAEAAAYRRWAAKGARGRPFRWEHHDPAEVELLTKAGGGDASPKARSPWPGWSRDLQLMERYAPLISRALTGAIGAQTLAGRWLEHGGSPDSAPAWLAGELDHGTRIAAVLAPVIHRLWTEGWYVGDVSAGFMLAQLGDRPAVTKTLEGRQSGLSKSVDGEFDHATDWGAWEPGDARTARALLEGSGRYAGLAQMLERGDVTIRSIASHRVDELARVLSQAAGEGWGNAKTTAALRGVLDDPRWARMVAITEVSRASSAASLERYRGNGVDAKSWMTASDQRVCPECEEDGQQGDIPIGDYFQDGSDAPPGHPTCRCSIAPGWLPAGEAGAASGGIDLGDLAGLSEEDAGLGLSDALGGVEADEWDAEIEEIRAALEEGEESRSGNLGGSVSGDVRRVVTKDGRKLVRKVLKDPYRNPDETEAVPYQRDAEVLGAQVARAVGLDAPAILVGGDDGEVLWMDLMHGQVAETAPGDSAARAMQSDQGVLMRLVNLLTDNSDGWRNQGNWLIGEDERLAMIDQSAAFQPWGPAERVPNWAHGILDFADFNGAWIDNPLTSGDVAEIRNRLTLLERRFVDLGRRDWYDKMMARLETIGEHASGLEGLL